MSSVDTITIVNRQRGRSLLQELMATRPALLTISSSAAAIDPCARYAGLPHSFGSQVVGHISSCQLSDVLPYQREGH